jgi:hypothetical protein
VFSITDPSLLCAYEFLRLHWFLNLELDYNKILEINSGQHEAISSRTKHLSKVKASLQGGFLGSLPLEYF